MGRNMGRKAIKVVQEPEKEIPAEVIASAIVDIAAGMKKLNTTRLSRRAIVTLIHEESRIARRDIEIVLNNLETLEETWLKRKGVA